MNVPAGQNDRTAGRDMVHPFYTQKSVPLQPIFTPSVNHSKTDTLSSCDFYLSRWRAAIRSPVMRIA
jgi:hypothetical protein